MEHGVVRIHRRGVERIYSGHLWVYRSDVRDTGDSLSGDIVSVIDSRDRVVGKAFYSSRSQIALRFLSRGDVSINEAFFRNRFEAADALRERLGVDPFLSRRIFSEGDLLPGLIVDRYGDVLVVQSLCQATDRLQPFLIASLQERYRPRTIILRNDTRVRDLEGLPQLVELIGEPLAEPIIVEEDGRRVPLLLSSGQKTGSYLDQRENRRAARRYARGIALDAFCHSGGFALQIAERCQRVDAVDISEQAIETGRAAATLNDIANVQFIARNAFDFLREQSDSGSPYDMIILDPPAFAKSKESLPGAIRGYKEINLRAMKLLQPQGFLVTCSCSHHLSEGLFAETLADAARDCGRLFRVIERRTQSPDHPILLSVPETYYLKCFIVQICT